jgi:hypothetical protein
MAGKDRPDPNFPGIQLYDSLAKWIERMNADHNNYTQSEEQNEERA